MTNRKINLDVIDEESASQAIDLISKIAEENKIDWALVGGLAMNFYGSDRLTKDIDMIATKRLPMPKEKIVGQLRQGGERYQAETEKKVVSVDWIIRSDEFKALFQEALAEAVKIEDLPILTPEWLVMLKFIAGRFKDQEDAIYLLSRKELVNREIIKEKIIKHFGKAAWGLAKHGYQRWYDLADGKTLEDERNTKDGYIDS
jgi:hypothetical protein